VNIALIALDGLKSAYLPPFVLIYLASYLEQQRHIVRIFDISRGQKYSLEQNERFLRCFQPQAIVIMGDSDQQLQEAAQACAWTSARLLLVASPRQPNQLIELCQELLASLDPQQTNKLTLANKEPLFPARHLIELESYRLRAPRGELQTALLASFGPEGSGLLRAPEQIINEMRSLAREHGIRHFLLLGAELSQDQRWLQFFAKQLIQAELDIAWEAYARISELDEETLLLLRASGCEALRLSLELSQILHASHCTSLKQSIHEARQCSIHIRAEMTLAPPFEAMPSLVDIAATFGFDDVQFYTLTGQEASLDQAQQIRSKAQYRFASQRNLQHCIEQFGPHLGPIIWNVRRSQMMHKIWQDQEEEQSASQKHLSRF
jgi:hypothetical protein